MPLISAVVLTLNEEKNLRRCLNSLNGLADEVIVMDSFSTDATKKIAEDSGVRFFSETWRGYAETKNHAATLARFPFVLFIDADEEISEQLKKSILQQKEKLSGAYSFNRLNNYCGKWIRHGGFYPDKKIRLYDKNQASWVGEFVHEKVVCKSGVNILHLEGDLLHYSYYSKEEHRDRLEKYARLGAKALKESKAAIPGLKKFISPLAKFVKHFFLRMGFLDGAEGFWLAFYSAKEVYLKYKYASA